MTSIHDAILQRIRGTGRGKVFTSKDFLDLGGREAVDQALSRLAKSGDTRRIGRGLYDYPKKHPRLGIVLSPDAEEIAAALARQTGSRVAPSGAVAANRLGLSTQVSAQPVYLTDGRTRKVRVGNLSFTVKHVAPKELPLGSPISAAVFQALRYLGRDAVGPEVVGRLRRTLNGKQRAALLKDARYATDWIADVVREVAVDQG